MKNSEITDPLFLEAVEAIDSGDIEHLKNLVTKYPRLLTDRLGFPSEGYFKNPYLLWFAADNPIRIEKLPANIIEITRVLVAAIKEVAIESYQYQLDYALGLVATGRIPRECGVQIAMMDLLINEGATPGGGLGALANGSVEAAVYLIERGGKLTLSVAVGLDRVNDVERLVSSANPEELLIALTVAAFYGKKDMVTYLLSVGANPNGYPKNNSGFHSHATPLHQAVASASMDTVKLLVEAGAKIDAKDLIYDGTAIDWADYMQREQPGKKESFAAIEDYLVKKKQAS
jgi:peptide-methionine (S)-S-oxide reductase